MVDAAVEAALMQGVRGPVTVAALTAATTLGAIALTAIAGLTDRERYSAPATQQQVQNDVRHGALDQGPPARKGDGQAAPAVGCFPPLDRMSYAPRGRLPAGALSFLEALTLLDFGTRRTRLRRG